MNLIAVTLQNQGIICFNFSCSDYETMPILKVEWRGRTGQGSTGARPVSQRLLDSKLDKYLRYSRMQPLILPGRLGEDPICVEDTGTGSMKLARILS